MTATDRLLAKVRRRLQVGWSIETIQTALPFIAGTALVLVLLGRLAPWSWPEPMALLVVVASIITIGAATFFVPVSVEMAARAADRGLGVKDAFTAALQFRDNERFGTEIQARAERFAASSTARDAVPWRGHPRRWAVTALIAASALGLAFIGNPQDDARQQAATTEAVLGAEAEQLEETADSIRDLEEPTEAELTVAAELDRLADELRELDELTEAEQLLRDASAALSPDTSQLFSTKAAVQGLNRSLEAQPLPGSSGDAAEQLEQLANNLDELTPEQTEALADRLDALAATQGAGNPAASAALSDAASALRAGNSGGAQAALGEASGAQRAGEGELREGQVGQAGSSAASDAANRVNDAQSGDGEGSGQGEGDGDGDGSGSGSGSGEGSGQGSGQGGSGQGDGGASGDVTGASGGSGASGQGGQGQAVGGGDSTEVGSETETPTLFDPGGVSDELFPGGSGQGNSETVGLGQGPTNAGSTQVPLSQVLGQYERQAVAALSDPSVAPSQRALVQRYFDRLAGLGGN